MAVRFVIGRSGTGKTAHCVRAIVDAACADPLGPPIFYVLPRQATFSAERQLVTESGLPAICRVRVESFDGLARAILADCGGAAIPQITATGRRAILSHLLRTLQPQLRYFAAVAHQPGLAGTLDATFAEFERTGSGPEQVLVALESQSAAAADADVDDLLHPKLSDLRMLYEAYTDFLGQDRLDPHRRNEQVVACMKDSRLLRDATVYVDGFYDFAESERRMIVGLAMTCRHVDVTILADPDSPIVGNVDRMPDEAGLFHRTEDAYRRLMVALRRNGAKVEAPVRLRDVYRFASPTLATLEQSVFGTDAAKRDASVAATPEAIAFVESNDRPAEVDAAARHILDLLRQGHRMRDIAVLVRNLDAYQDAIDASFREHGIAFFLDRRRTAAHHPLLRLVRSLMQVATGGWQSSPLFALMKTGLAGLSLTEADELEDYVLDHHIRTIHWPMPEPWEFRRTHARDEDDANALATAVAKAQRADGLRRTIVAAIEPFVSLCAGEAQKPLRIYATELYTVLVRFNVATTLAQWADRATAARQFDQAGEHQQVWAEFVELLDQLVELLGQYPVTSGEFIDLLNTSLDSFDLAFAPATIDQVLVGQVDRTRLPDVKATLVLGLNDGDFPRVPREDSVLSDRDRSLLRKGDLEIKGDGERQLLDERLLAYSAFTAPSHSLYLSRVACDTAGKAQAPSPYWSRLRALLPDAPLAKVGSSSSQDPRLIATPRQLVVSLMRWARDATAVGDDATHAALYHWLATHAADGSPIAEMRYRAWGALSYANASSLRPETAATLFASPLEATVNRLETFAACPFKHFAQYGLDLHVRRDEGFTSIDLSRVYHNMLERLVRQMIRAKQEWRDLTDEWTDQRIAAAAHEVDMELKREMAIEPGRSQYLLSRIERTIRQIVKRQRVVSSRTQLSGGYVGVSFGGSDATLGPLKLTTPRGRALHVHGRIDRIDLLPGSSHAAVFDYKLTTGGLSAAAIYNGLSLQLLTYLLVLQANGHELSGAPITPAAGFYLQLMRGYEAVAHPDEALDPTTDDFHFAPKARGLLDATHLGAFDNVLGPGASPVVQVHVNKEGGFGYRESSDICDADEFLGLLDYVRGKLASITDAIVTGDIRPRPYRLGRKSPCAQCGYRSLCRFDVTLNGYNIIGGISRDELLTKNRHAPTEEEH